MRVSTCPSQRAFISNVVSLASAKVGVGEGFEIR